MADCATHCGATDLTCHCTQDADHDGPHRCQMCGAEWTEVTDG